MDQVAVFSDIVKRIPEEICKKGCCKNDNAANGRDITGVYLPVIPRNIHQVFKMGNFYEGWCGKKHNNKGSEKPKNNNLYAFS